MRISRTQMESLATSGGNVVGADGQKIGSIGQVYVDDSTGEPSFVTVKTGLFGTAESFVPLQDATVTGSDIRVAYNKTEVKDAPRVDPDERITPEEEQRLYAHYGISSPRGHTSGTERTGPSDTGDYGTSSNDTSGSTTDDAKRSGSSGSQSLIRTSALPVPARISVKRSTRSSCTRSVRSWRRRLFRWSGSGSAPRR